MGIGLFFPKRVINKLSRNAKTVVYIVFGVSPYGAVFVVWLAVTFVFGVTISFVARVRPESKYWQEWSGWQDSKDTTSFPVQEEEFIFM
jgi:hypothetical protein